MLFSMFFSESEKGVSVSALLRFFAILRAPREPIEGSENQRFSCFFLIGYTGSLREHSLRTFLDFGNPKGGHGAPRLLL